uniref:Uncharacterized protein n=1 Tax=Meloidogyne javanica TaxID=6303 RepID=A0A915MJA1_MELJA
MYPTRPSRPLSVGSSYCGPNEVGNEDTLARRQRPSSPLSVGSSYLGFNEDTFAQRQRPSSPLSVGSSYCGFNDGGNQDTNALRQRPTSPLSVGSSYCGFNGGGNKENYYSAPSKSRNRGSSLRNDEMQEQMKRTSERKIEKDRLNEIQDDDLSSADFSSSDPMKNDNVGNCSDARKSEYVRKKSEGKNKPVINMKHSNITIKNSNIFINAFPHKNKTPMVKNNEPSSSTSSPVIF